MAMTIEARNPRLEAQRLLAGKGSARVLEPSPPAVNDGPYFADDPVAVDGHDSETSLVVPAGTVPAGSESTEVIDWNRWLTDHPDRHDRVAELWLGGDRRLRPAPSSLVATRLALHRLAVYVVAPARHKANGKFGLRWTRGGFGTPFFGRDRQIRVEGPQLVDQQDGAVRHAPITSLRAAADFIGADIDSETAAEHDSPAVGDPDEMLTVDLDAVAFMSDWYGMAFAALEQLRADEASIDPSRPQLWPGHFDPAIEVGSEDGRASFGASPGDQTSDEPYLYVSLWWPDRLGIDADDSFWNADGYVGRRLSLSDFPSDADPVDVAAGFWQETRDRIAESAPP